MAESGAVRLGTGWVASFTVGDDGRIALALISVDPTAPQAHAVADASGSLSYGVVNQDRPEAIEAATRASDAGVLPADYVERAALDRAVKAAMDAVGAYENAKNSQQAAADQIASLPEEVVSALADQGVEVPPVTPSTDG